MKLFLLVAFVLFASHAGAQSVVPDKPSNIVFLLDISNSMGRDDKMKLLKRSTEELCKLLDAKDRISLLTFGTNVSLIYSTTSYSGPDSLLKVISRVRSTASATNINSGIYEAYTLGEKLKVQGTNHILLITDGEFVLNNFSKDLVTNKNDIRMTCVIIGKGVSAEKAVKYVTEELKLKAITLVNEDEDVKKLSSLVQPEIPKYQ
jgi:Mg-chelatase subunit ChlD